MNERMTKEMYRAPVPRSYGVNMGNTTLQDAFPSFGSRMRLSSSASQKPFEVVKIIEESVEIGGHATMPIVLTQSSPHA